MLVLVKAEQALENSPDNAGTYLHIQHIYIYMYICNSVYFCMNIYVC
jgi:hypothetical protein